MTKIHWNLKRKSQSKVTGKQGREGKGAKYWKEPIAGFIGGHKWGLKQFERTCSPCWGQRATAGDLRCCIFMSSVQRVSALPTETRRVSRLAPRVFLFFIFQTSVNVSCAHAECRRDKRLKCSACRSFTSSSESSCWASWRTLDCCRRTGPRRRTPAETTVVKYSRVNLNIKQSWIRESIFSALDHAVIK